MSKKTMSRRQLITSGIAIAILALLFGLWSKHNIAQASPQKKITWQTGTLLPTPKNLESFTLVDAKYQVFNNSNFNGHWSLVFFGFTNCPFLCPTTLTALNEMYGTLTSEKIQPLPQVVFISVDTERDNPKKADKYAKTFNKAFTGITGAKDQVDKLAKQLNVLYMKVDQGAKNNYTIDHSGTVLLIDPAGRLHGLFTQPIDPKAVAKDYKRLVEP